MAAPVRRLVGDARGGWPPAPVDLCPAADWPDTANVVVNLSRVRAVIDRVAGALDELARARQVADLDNAAVLPDRRAERRRRVAEPDLEFRAFCGYGRDTCRRGRAIGPIP